MKIRWNGKLETICNHIRGLSPFPGAWTELQAVGKDSGVLTLKIFKAARIRQSHNLPAGEVRTDGKTFFDVYVEGGIVRVLELQLSGKKRMRTEDFLRGFRSQSSAVNSDGGSFRPGAAAMQFSGTGRQFRPES